MRQVLAARPLVLLGIGSELRGDDAWALHLVQAVKEMAIPGVHSLWGATVPENLLGPVARLQPEEVLLCDAGLIPVEAGQYGIYDPGEVDCEAVLSHRLSLALLAKQIQARVRCGVHMLLLRPATLELGEALSPAVQLGLERLLDVVRAALEPQESRQSAGKPFSARGRGGTEP